MPSPRVWVHKRSPLSPRNQGCCKLSPKNVVVRKRRAESSSLPQQNILSPPVKDITGLGDIAGEFIWHKKVKRETDGTVSIEELRRKQKRKIEENAKELLQLKRRRKEREKIRFETQERKYEEERSKIAELELSWSEEQEEEFFMKQVPLRSQIRLQQGRAKPIDLLARYVTATNQMDVENIETEDPLNNLNNLAEEDLKDLAVDVKVYKKVHHQPSYQVFWNAMETIVNFELSYCENVPQGRARPLNPQIEEEIRGILNGKTTNQLECLKKNIEEKLRNSEHIDVTYWERLLQHIQATFYRQKIMEEHKAYLMKMMRIFQNQKKKIAAGIGAPSCSLHTDEISSNKVGKDVVHGATQNMFMEVKERFLVPCEEDRTVYTEEYSIEFLSPDDLPQGTVVLDAEGDMKELKRSRERVIGGRGSKPDYSVPLLRGAPSNAAVIDEETDRKNLEEARKRVLLQVQQRTESGDSGDVSVKDVELLGMTYLRDGETEFNLEVPIPIPGYETDDKYRPRKPRYFNKIQTGFFWSRYNRTHYDSDHPPPKMVLGYRFNIFYPDLMDKSVVPRYTVKPCKDNRDVSIIRFSAGPPYEDVAFQIVNDRAWDKSERHGFRNWYRKGVLQLWFRFKKMPYRR